MIQHDLGAERSFWIRMIQIDPRYKGTCSELDLYIPLTIDLLSAYDLLPRPRPKCTVITSQSPASEAR
ncbi:hypothetical protein CGCF413_v014146 [Colletotrichum fructicola]|nr:hypothetical protein CGCF413_v014146 [Colletotrichum fructicola]